MDSAGAALIAGFSIGLTFIDYMVIVVYFAGMIMIGYWAMKRVRDQVDYFMAGRRIGKLLQVFCAFGAGTSADSPVGTARNTYRDGLSGIWTVLTWLFVTPFYWIFGLWYRRMRYITLGDFWEERYESQGLAAAYAIFGMAFYAVYLSIGFTAFEKTMHPLLGIDASSENAWLITASVAAVTLVYGVIGGLLAVMWTDFLQGLFIILLSMMLLPSALYRAGWFSGMHESVPSYMFDIIGSPLASDFTLGYIAAITLLNLYGIVVQPHMLVNAGSAKTEFAARLGVMAGNFLKRLCTLLWALTALACLAVFAGRITDPDHVWGYATGELLGPLGIGLVGLMVACLMAALMSSADAYMISTSGLIVHNMYRPLRPRRSERHYVQVGRLSGGIVIVAAALLSRLFANVFDQMKFGWELPVAITGTFWLGIFWRRATRAAAWVSVGFSAMVFFILPLATAALMTRDQQRALAQTATAPRENIGQRPTTVTAEDIERDNLVVRYEGLTDRTGEWLTDDAPPTHRGRTFLGIEGKVGFKPRFVQRDGRWYQYLRVGPRAFLFYQEATDDDGVAYGRTAFFVDLWFINKYIIDLTTWKKQNVEVFRLGLRIVMPVVLGIVVSLLTKPNSKLTLDRFFARMMTPVSPDRERDAAQVAASYAEPTRYQHRKLFGPGSSLEVYKPQKIDVIGFVLAALGTFAIIGLALLMAWVGS